MKIDFPFELTRTQQKWRKKAKKEKYHNIDRNNYKKAKKCSLSQKFMHFKFILMQSLSLSYKVIYFDFAVFQILLMSVLPVV